MNAKVFKRVVALGIAVVMSFSLMGVYAVAPTVDAVYAVDASYINVEATYIGIVPFWTHIISTAHGFNDLGGGRLRITGDTTVRPATPNAGVVIELQQNGNTIRTWSDTRRGVAALSTEHFVARGHQYRLRVTHLAINTMLAPVEIVVFYSRTVIP